ncbi:cytochrome P450 90A1 isoform X1 [Eucalyptus grandis]|uniref:cytochrome P450 90A1 isoform X1 n=1 Tax=Eucalyptus grandis TaxID=71139 RepID=UPI00192EDE01|nr:cytochrome P450 90A1 isoform X1 [Eucalyptus grandis]XP_039157613.1 cytochrome P450 90A1 isoform X1 [Eucalyptus grandis]XP_039157614.1 cytochrome P450 90A1 isoform X1 [Eucalyptus grandis]
MMIRSKEELIFFVRSYYDVLFAVLVSVGFMFYFSAKAKKISGERDHIPGRLGVPFVGETFSFLSATNSTKGCYEFVRLRRLWYGKWFKTRIFGKVHVFIPTTGGAKTVFASDFAQFNKGYVKSMADAVGKKSLLCVPHESHKRIRHLLSDPFSMPSLSKFVTKFDKMLCQRLKKLEEHGKRFVVLDFNMKIAFDAMCEMLMSVTEESMLQQIEKDCTDVSNAMLSFPVMIPGTRYYRGIKARNRLMETFREMIEERRGRGKGAPEDFLQSMLDRDSLPPEEKLDDSEIMDNLLTLIIAGQTTTAAAMMWSVKFLDENPEAQDRLREEQLAILRKKPQGAALTLEDLNSMSYGLKVAKETLRMSNVLLWYPRVAITDCTIEGHSIKKGWHVNVDATCIHYDPSIYKDPVQFNPSRFDVNMPSSPPFVSLSCNFLDQHVTDEHFKALTIALPATNLQEMQKPYSFIPFGSGPRTCLGMNMAKVTMLAFLHRLTSGYSWTVDDPDTSLEKKAHIPRLRSGCPITLKAI